MKRLVWLLTAAAIIITPFLATGCGADDTEADKKVGVNTIGPGNLEETWIPNNK